MPEGLVMREEAAMARVARRSGESQHRKRRSTQAYAAPFKQINLKAAGMDVGVACHGVAVPRIDTMLGR